MIAARFRLVGWVAGCAGAALLCYMASQSVAAERSALNKVDAEIADTNADIARLTTEITARSRAGQIERWNGVLALQAARPVQYVESGVQLASLAGGKPLPLDPQITSQTAVQMVAYQPAQAAQAPVAQPMLHQATFVRPKPNRLGDSDAGPALIKASYEAPAPARVSEQPVPKPAAPKQIKAMEKIAAAIDPKPKRAAEAPKATKLAAAEPLVTKPKAKPAKHDDGLLPDDLGKLIAAEKFKPRKAGL
jgi:hypothetical protein